MVETYNRLDIGDRRSHGGQGWPNHCPQAIRYEESELRCIGRVFLLYKHAVISYRPRSTAQSFFSSSFFSSFLTHKSFGLTHINPHIPHSISFGSGGIEWYPRG